MVLVRYLILEYLDPWGYVVVYENRRWIYFWIRPGRWASTVPQGSTQPYGVSLSLESRGFRRHP